MLLLKIRKGACNLREVELLRLLSRSTSGGRNLGDGYCVAFLERGKDLLLTGFFAVGQLGCFGIRVSHKVFDL